MAPIGNCAQHDLRLCSFCGKSQNDVYMMIAGPAFDLFICDECADSARDIVVEQRIKDASRSHTVEGVG